MKDKKIVILGVGNLLFSDEGIGVHVAQALEKKKLPENVSVYDGSTLGILSAPLFIGADLLILVDAVDAQGEPGEVKVYNKDDIMLSRLPLKLSPHQIGIQETLLICELRDECPKEIIFFGVIPASYETSIELTESGKKAMEKVLDEIDKLLTY